MTRKLHPERYPGTACTFRWAAWHGGLGRYIEYQCGYGADHLRQHHGASVRDDAGRYTQTFGAAPRSRILNRA
jgi:hypothetical protein